MALELTEAGTAFGLKDIMKWFEIPIGKFTKEWKRLSDDDKAQIRNALGDSTLNYDLTPEQKAAARDMPIPEGMAMSQELWNRVRKEYFQ